MTVYVHKAVEPDKLSREGKKRFATLTTALIQGDPQAMLLPKYDGVYAQFLYDAATKSWQAFSRTGERLLSVGPAITDVFDVKALHDFAYIGELWLPDENHSTINGRARKQSVQHLELKLFDSYDRTDVVASGTDHTSYLNRRDFLFSGGPVSIAPIMPTAHRINVLDDAYDLARELTLRPSAYDGLILRDAGAYFVPGRGTDGEIIKIKPRRSGDFRVVATTPGIGNRDGGYGAFVVDLGGGVRSEVGTGLTQAEVFGDDPVGRIAEVEYLAVTPAGKLREPSFKRFRDDKTEADVLDFTQQEQD